MTSKGVGRLPQPSAAKRSRPVGASLAAAISGREPQNSKFAGQRLAFLPLILRRTDPQSATGTLLLVLGIGAPSITAFALAALSAGRTASRDCGAVGRGGGSAPGGTRPSWSSPAWPGAPPQP
jgi:hypothetical protein